MINLAYVLPEIIPHRTTPPTCNVNNVNALTTHQITRVLSILTSQIPSNQMAENGDDAGLLPHKREQALSATHVPTLNSFHKNIKRFSSYSADENDAESLATQPLPADVLKSSENNNGQQKDNRSSENKVKAALTELLNDADVKNNPDGNKSVQNLLMKTEREWKKHRRESLHEMAQE